jgi:hypothetical protein
MLGIMGICSSMAGAMLLTNNWGKGRSFGSSFFFKAVYLWTPKRSIYL